MTYEIVFVAATALAVASALGVVLSGNPFYSALWLLMNLASLATFYLLLQADFLAAAQVIVYAGAVMIMFLFVIAYLGGRAHEPTRGRPVWQVGAAVVAAVAIAAEVLVAVFAHELGPAASVRSGYGSARTVGVEFISRYLLAFEATSILLLVAAVGGVVLGSRRPEIRRLDEPEPEPFVTEVPRRELPLAAAVMQSQTEFEVASLRRRGGEAVGDGGSDEAGDEAPAHPRPRGQP
jgi:NADH-quinone oxidoreductase subunit J